MVGVGQMVMMMERDQAILAMTLMSPLTYLELGLIPIPTGILLSQERGVAQSVNHF